MSQLFRKCFEGFAKVPSPVLFLVMFFLIWKFDTKSQNDLDMELRLPPLFSDHMVFQRNMEIPVWGWAKPGESITVEICGRKKMSKADEKGEWIVHLDPLGKGGPFDLVVSGSKTVKIRDVLIGEVWVCSGQSNMDMTVDSQWGKVLNEVKEVQEANYPQIRFFNTRHTFSGTPLRDFESDGGWMPCSPESTKNFSAAAYFFGRHIHKELNVPVGLIRAAWGGTPIECWMPLSTQKEISFLSQRLENVDDHMNSLDDYKEKYPELIKSWMKKLEEKDLGFQSETRWFDPSLDAKDWDEIELPSLWDSIGDMGSFDGIVWFTREIILPDECRDKKSILHLGTIDDEDITWINGKRVGERNLFFASRDYDMPQGVLQPGKNVVTVRILDTGGHGGFSGQADKMAIEFITGKESQSFSLAGKWKYKASCDLKSLPPKPVPAEFVFLLPSVLYNGMIAPLMPYAIQGVIWYQGESNAARAFEYRTLFPAMISSWRKNWGQGDFPFLFVQIANFGTVPKEPGENDWAELREAQLMTLSLPNTGMAVTIDIGEPNDIHPRNKQDVGYRLGLAAKAVAYGEKIIFSGPVYRKDSMKIEGGKIRLYFDHVGGGLMAKDGDLKGFAIAGKDKKFVWAKANIDGDSVLAWSDKVSQPVAVRYGWAASPVFNLYNREGLPASPFRTDNWQGITETRDTK
jgi:sialate O-acetylesterase